MRIAYELTTAVAYFHSVGWVHELICPHNVTLSYDRGDLAPESGGLGQVTLFGFGNSRRDSRHVISHGPGASDWTVQLYCHPARQFERLQEELANQAASTKPGDVLKQDKKTRFEFKHDVYALGVVLLEIGLWQDLETLEGTGPDKTPLLMDAKPDKRKEILLGAADDLVGNAGELYANIVKKCLQADITGISVNQVGEVLESLRL
jgi:serine/threonine protein kinase